MIDLSQIATSTLIKNGKPDGLGMITPINIVKDMVDLVFNKLENEKLDKPIWNLTFLDPACKSGNFLREIYCRLMNNKDMIKEFPDNDYRSELILNKQLFGICFRETDALIATRNVYGRLARDSHIKYIPKWLDIVKSNDIRFTIESLRETFGDMNFDVVIGNPPYNNDMYLDFVQLGKKIVGERQHSSVCMITPAKWQAKGGEKNEQFRREIVPYMSDIVYYPDTNDVFGIAERSGISYYIIRNNIQNNCNITNICSKVKAFNGKCKRSILNQESLINCAISIENKMGKFNKLVFKTLIGEDYRVCVDDTLSVGGPGHGKGTSLFNKEGTSYVIGKMYIAKKGEECLSNSITIRDVFESNSYNTCNSFVSYCNCKLIRFIIMCHVSTRAKIFTNDYFKFVPDPGKFDHIFTDAELYEKYGLTEEEIAIIESVIKERK